jgi:hypothetical protein
MRSPRRRPHPELIIAEAEARFWNRPPAAIHASSPRPALTIANLGDVVREEARADHKSREREEYDDRVVAMHIQAVGPAALTHPAIQAQLGAIWQAIWQASGAEQRRAKTRWRKIMSRTTPDLRRYGERKGPAASPTRIAACVSEAERAIAEAKRKKRRQSAALYPELKTRLSDWPPRAIGDLVKAIRSRRRHDVRRIVHRAIGARFELRGGGLAELVAAGRRIEKLKKLAEEGRRRYLQWASTRF